MIKKIARWKAGNVVKIPLDGEIFGYGLLLDFPLIAFFDLRTRQDEILSSESFKNASILFKIWVMKQAVTTGRWQKVDCLPIPDEHLRPPDFFKQDIMNGKLSIYRDEADIPATYDQCVHLEAAAVWEAEHVEDRLRDHFNGKPNIWRESLRPK